METQNNQSVYVKLHSLTYKTGVLSIHLQSVLRQKYEKGLSFKPCNAMWVGKYLPFYVALYPRRLKFSSSLLWEPASLTVNKGS